MQSAKHPQHPEDVISCTKTNIYFTFCGTAFNLIKIKGTNHMICAVEIESVNQDLPPSKLRVLKA